MSKNFSEISQSADQILLEYDKLYDRLDLSFRGDFWIAQNIRHLKSQLKIIAETEFSSKLLTAFEAPAVHHLKTLQEILSAEGWDDNNIPQPIRNWRRDVETTPYSSIPLSMRKEIFDYFLRNDVHGKLDSNNIVFLSRGANEPRYFNPPTIFNVAVDAANELGLWGYSDPLGHEETREEIAKLERLKRNQPNISKKNIASIMGGISGLDTVLTMLSHESIKKGCIVVAPNYAPIIDNANLHFETQSIDLSDDYVADMDKINQMVIDQDVSVVIISVPHNPYGLRDIDQHIKKLHQTCVENGTFIVCDEIIFDPKISELMNPIDYPNLVIVSSYSKMYNIPGSKMGHLLANESFINRFYKYADTKYGSPASFFYLAATYLNAIETASILNTKTLPHRFIENKFSNNEVAFEDFALWKKFNKLHKDLQNLIAETCLQNLGFIGLEKMIGLDDPSTNVIMRVKGQGSAYQASLNLIATRNISAMPIECFYPPDTWNKRDLRVTIAVDPEKLATALPQLICGIDEIVAKETMSEWSHPDDILWLNTTGLSDRYFGAGLWGRALRTQTRLKEIFTLAGKGEVPESLNRAATLLSIKHSWSLIAPEEKPFLLSHLTGRNSINRDETINETFDYLLNRPGKLNTLPNIPDDIRLLLLETLEENTSNDNTSSHARLLKMAEIFQGVSLQGNSIEEIKNRLQNIGTHEKTPLLEQILAL